MPQIRSPQRRPKCAMLQGTHGTVTFCGVHIVFHGKLSQPVLTCSPGTSRVCSNRVSSGCAWAPATVSAHWDERGNTPHPSTQDSRRCFPQTNKNKLIFECLCHPSFSTTHTYLTPLFSSVPSPLCPQVCVRVLWVRRGKLRHPSQPLDQDKLNDSRSFVVERFVAMPPPMSQISVSGLWCTELVPPIARAC